MEDLTVSDDEYYYSDYDSLNGFENDDSDVPTVNPKGSATKMITRESLLDAQREDLRRVMDLLSLREHHACTLLIHHRWNVDKLFEVLVENGKSNLFADVGISVADYKDDGSSSPIMCEICIEEVPGHTTTIMDCGHCF